MISETLRNFEPKEARVIANNALRTLLEAEKKQLTRLPEAHSAAVDNFLKELAQKARANLDALTHVSRSKLLELASDAVRSIAIGDVQAAESKARLGDLGLLGSADYKLRPTDQLKAQIKERALSLRTVEAAVRDADAQQHLFPPSGESEAPFISMFVRLLNREAVRNENADANWCLVLAGRKGQWLNLFSAWQIFEADISLADDGKTPLDLFKAFVEAFGESIEVGPSRVDKLIMYERVPTDLLAKFSGSAAFEMQMSVRPRSNGETDVAMVFAINTEKYKAALKRHGVAVSPSSKR